MSGRSSSAPSAALVAPALGTANPLIGAVQAMGRALRDVADRQHQIVAGTIKAGPVSFSAISVVSIALDTAPDNPIQAHTLDGWAPAIGTRVLCLLYPPRGVVILGQISDSILIHQSGASVSHPGNNYAILQTWTNKVAAGIIYLNDQGGSLISTPMRAVNNSISNTGFTVSTGTFTLPDASYAITVPYPQSGNITVDIYSQFSVTAAAATTSQGIWAPEIRDGTSAGAVLSGYTAQDIYSAVTPICPAASTIQGSVAKSQTFSSIAVPTTGTLWVGLKARVFTASGVGAVSVTSQRGTITVTPSL